MLNYVRLEVYGDTFISHSNGVHTPRHLSHGEVALKGLTFDSYSARPSAYIFMGNFSSRAFVPTAEGVGALFFLAHAELLKC